MSELLYPTFLISTVELLFAESKTDSVLFEASSGDAGSSLHYISFKRNTVLLQTRTYCIVCPTAVPVLGCKSSLDCVLHSSPMGAQTVLVSLGRFQLVWS